MSTPLPRRRPAVLVVAADAPHRSSLIAALADRLTGATVIRTAADEEGMFERSQQLGTVGRRRGSGLELTISRQIVGDHGGRISADPGRAAGAPFVVDLPDAGGRRGRDGAV